MMPLNILPTVPPFVQSFVSLYFHQNQQCRRYQEELISLKFETATTNYLDSLSILEEKLPSPLFEPCATREQLDADNNRITSEVTSPSQTQIPSDCSSHSTISGTDSSTCKNVNVNIKPMIWDGQQIAENAFHVNLPPLVVKELRDYADRLGITRLYRQLVVEGCPLPPGGERAVKFSHDDNNYNWMIQRPKSHWKSNMHWTSPADEEAHDDYLRVLSKGGFDSVLEEVGDYFSLDAISAYHLSFIGVSHCEKGFIHADINDSGRKAFNMIIPLILQEEKVRNGGSTGELEILSDDETTTRFYKYEYNTASMVGDHALHATAACDYRRTDTSTCIDTNMNINMRLAATVYLGDVTPSNVNNLLLSLTQAYPPVGDAQHLLDRAGSHWSKTDPAKKLPLWQLG